jgi:hypothetical protein
MERTILMKNINRRDYLRNMGIAAAGTLGAAKLNLFDAMGRASGNHRDSRIETVESLEAPGFSAAPQASPQPWPWTGELPNATVRLVFAGMVAFTYKKKEGRVVFHRSDDDHHKLKIVAYRSSAPCNEIYRNEAIPKKTTMDFEIKNKPSDSTFFHGGAFERSALQGNAKDFRWLLDLEDLPFNNGKLKRKEDKFSTKLNVRHGTFYTYKHTASTFLYDNGSGTPTKLGYVPKVMATDVSLEQGECVSLKINGTEVLPYPLCSGAKYEIFFLNECDASCTHSDFSMVFDAFEKPKRFELTLEHADDNGPTDDLCLPVPTSNRIRRLNDEAPCMGGGFGGGGGFP